MSEHVYDAGLEMSVIRASIASDQARKWAVRTLAPDEFFVKEHPPIWRALTRMVEAKLEYDPGTMRRFVRDEGGDADGSYLGELERTASVPKNLEWLVETLKWDATRARALDGPVAQLVEDLRDPKADPSSVTGQARAVAKSLEDRTGRKYIRRPTELARGYVAGLRQRRISRNFYPSGFLAMDDEVHVDEQTGDEQPLLTEGFAPKRTSVFAGLSGSGKSTTMSELLIRQARIGRRPLYCSWEMDADSMIDVMASSITAIPLFRIVQGIMSDDEKLKVERAVTWITSNVRFMDYPFARRRERSKYRETNDDRLDVLEGYIAESGCNVIVYDLWERMLCDLSYEGTTRALYRQQAIHQDFNVHGVIVHQLRGKDVEKRADKRPTRDAIKGTGAFVEVADLIFGIHREGQLKAVPDNTMELICLKQRKGIANWAMMFDWIPGACRIRGGRRVSYDPGLDGDEMDAIAGIKVKRHKGKKGGRPGRPE